MAVLPPQRFCARPMASDTFAATIHSSKRDPGPGESMVLTTLRSVPA